MLLAHRHLPETQSIILAGFEIEQVKMPEQIVLFDIPSREPRTCWSLNPWKSESLIQQQPTVTLNPALPL